MKKVFLSALLIAGIGTTLTSCNNGDYTATPAGGTNWNPGSTSGGGGTGNVIMEAKVNGVKFSAANGSFVYNGVAGIMGLSASKSIMINLLGYDGPDKYEIGPMANQAGYTDGTMQQGTSGEVIITSDANNIVHGTFHFEGTGLTVTDGVFNLPKTSASH